MTSYTIFETAIGFAGLAWADQGLVGAHLPDPTPDAARRGVLRKFPDAIEAEPTREVTQTIAGVRDLLAGGSRDLTDIAIDIGRAPEFDARVYAIARAIPPGQTLTYGEIAMRLGDRLLARDVGAALGRNPWPMIVPCHRVTAAGGKLGGFSARGGVNTKARLLAIEGAAVVAGPLPTGPKAAAAPPQPDLFA